MKTHDIMEWYTPEELHKASMGWLLELEFIKDEHLFFEDLITSFTLQLVGNKGATENQKFIDALKISRKWNNSLIKIIKKHDKNLKLLLDDKDRPDEDEAYKKEHKNIMNELNAFLKDYKALKTQLFSTIKDVLKKDKQKRLTA